MKKIISYDDFKINEDHGDKTDIQLIRDNRIRNFNAVARKINELDGVSAEVIQDCADCPEALKVMTYPITLKVTVGEDVYYYTVGSKNIKGDGENVDFQNWSYLKHTRGGKSRSSNLDYPFDGTKKFFAVIKNKMKEEAGFKLMQVLQNDIDE